MASKSAPFNHTIARLGADFKPTCDPSGGPLAALEPVHIECYPWYERGERQATAVRTGWTERAIYLRFECRDRHVCATRTELNSDVCEDSCVEFFASVPEDPESYFNLEVNCCGTLHLGYGGAEGVRRMVTPAVAALIAIATSVPGPTKTESPGDDGWLVEVALPFEAISCLAGRPVHVEEGTRWRGNFFRCGGATDPQYACWAPISAPAPAFHLPEFFGTLTFGA